MADGRRELVERLEPVIQRVRDRRQPIETRWMSGYAAWRGQRTRFHYNSENFRHYIPAARRAIERTTVRLRQMLAPDNDFFEVYPGDVLDTMSTTTADAVSSWMLYLMEQRICIKSVISQLSRSLVMYGRAVTKAQVEVVKWSEDPEGEIEHSDVWPSLRAVDVFSFYHFPETTTDLDRCQLIFEDAMYPWSCYLDAVGASGGLIDGINRSELEKPIWPNNHLQRLSLIPIAAPSDMVDVDSRRESVQVGDFVQITEGFMKRQSKWMHFWIVWNLKTGPRMVRLHDLVGDRQPYRLAVSREIPGESDSTSMMDDIEPLQILLNDQYNRMEEAASLAAVPPVRVNPQMVTRADSLVFRPRAKWLVEPDGVRVLEIPDTSRNSQAAAMQTMNLITSVFSPGGIVEGQPPRGSPRAGFAFSSMVNLSMADIKDLADTIEERLLTPALHDLYKLTILFVPREQVLKIPGTAMYQPQNLTTYDLYGGWNFRWVGHLQAQDMQVRGQRVQQFLQGVAPMLEPLQMQGSSLNLAFLLKMIWRDVLGERGFDRILTQVPPPPPPGMTPPGAQGLQAGAGGNPAQILASMLGGPAGAGTPENAVRQQSRQQSGARGAPSQ